MKASEDGWVILSSSPGAIPASARARIVPDGDRPPPPPSEAENPGAGALPAEYALHQNYPNPFNPVTEIRFDLPEAGDVILRLYSILGEEVATLVDGPAEAGFRSVRFDASRLASGVYFYKLTAGAFGAVRKMALVR